MRAGVVLLVFLVLAFPVGLAFAVYVTAEPSLAAQPVPAAITQRVIAEPSRTTTEDDERTTTDRSGSDRCFEAEHRDDPECQARSGSGSSGSGSDGSDDDNSGSGSSNSGSGSSNSGSGSSNSGPGGGDD